MKRTISGAALALCAAVGCARPATPENFAGEYEEALCAWASGCGVFQSRGQCRDALAWDTQGRFEYLLEALDADRVDFNPEAAEACFEQIVDLPCAEDRLGAVLYYEGPPAAPQACQDVFVGKVRNYDPCMNSEECEGDNAVCGFSPTCPDACCAGSCRDLGNPPEIGEMCSSNRRCGDDAFCARDPNTGAFTVCTERRGAGEDCGDVSDSCAEGLYCDFNGEQVVCAELLSPGEPCFDSRACAGGMQCYDNGTGERRCLALPGEGDGCSRNNYPACARIDNFCSDAGVCVKGAAPGESCADAECMPYAFCDYNGGAQVCVAYASLGDACGYVNSYVSCIGHLFCGEGDRCRAPEPEQVCPVPEL